MSVDKKKYYEDAKKLINKTKLIKDNVYKYF